MRGLFRCRELSFSTSKQYELVDLTREVEKFVSESGVRNGFCLVFAPHATAAIIANEHEAGLIQDIVSSIKRLFPRDGMWRHNLIDDNAAAHLGSSFIGASRVFPIVDGRLVRGTWQNIFLVEMDGPRFRRRVMVCVLGEP